MAAHLNTHNSKALASTIARKKIKSKTGESKIGKVLGEFKAGKLRSSAGPKVKSRKQAIAIALSEARRANS